MAQYSAPSDFRVELQKMPTWLKNVTLIAGTSILIGLLAHVSIPLPFTPIPLVFQVSFILFSSVLLGSKRAAGAVLAFLAQGAAGLPVFAGGASGIATLIGPRGGYLLGYLIAAYVVGRLIELSGQRSILNAFLAMFAGSVIVYACGAFGLSFFVGGTQALLLGVAPFVIGDLLKIALGLKVLQWIGWVQKRA